MDRLEAMRIFSDVAITESLTKTAQRLDLSRAYVTRGIAELEDWMKVRLLQRTTRIVKLTTEGETFLSHCHHLINYIEHVENEQLEKRNNLNGELVITSSIAFSQRYLAPALIRFKQLYPGMIMKLIATDEVLNLVSDKVDLALRVTNHPDENLIGRKLAVFPLHIVASPEYLAQCEEIKLPEDLNNHPCIGYSHTKRPKWRFIQPSREVVVQPDISFYASESGTLMEYTLAGGGIAVLPEFLTKKWVEDGRFIRILPDWDLTQIAMYALYPTRKNVHPAVGKFLTFIHKELNQGNAK